ncbi:TadE/TadG family type IV pilus assembly protein [Paraburkholderia kururiensis]|uniref:TadE/TadG family type IV pilus assembly protein n=1 Tax=Paraburkholderia kururiensis TaxID=984307 RepID=A0ABZ0WS34_9BURK|nr:TadE/TadG family type IV pilus assembly protein [Paraburkholderia kururiensis]WQD80074.1 TadE/TadG family type IV pilus assembly protein [Paraburkholderia kururiensis]
MRRPVPPPLAGRRAPAAARALPRLGARLARPLHAAAPSEQRGVVALEYAIVLSLFLAVVIGMFQFGVIFTTQSLMDNAARDVARLIRIGTFTGTSGSYSSALTTAVCNDLTVSGLNLVPSCSSKIQIYVASAASSTPAGSGFKTLAPAAISNGVMTQTKASLSPKYDVILEIGYQMPWVAAFFSGNAMLTSTLAFQTEPY